MAAKRAKKAADVEKYIDESGEMMTLSYDQKQKLLMFYGRDTIYSNFRPSPFQLDGVEFNCVEQYFQYQKAQVFGDLDASEKILQSDSPRVHKAIGRKVQNYNETVWNELCLDIMRKGVLAKFQQNSDLREGMMKHSDARFVEASPRDKKWGIGLGIKDSRAKDPKQWPGENLLGRILDEVRDQILADSSKK